MMATMSPFLNFQLTSLEPCVKLNRNFEGIRVILRFRMAKASPLTFYSIITPFDAFEYHVFENIMENGAFENGAFAHLEQMLHFP